MQIAGLKYGAKLLELVDFPVARSLEADATLDELQQLMDRVGKMVVKPVFSGGVGKKGKAGLIRFVDNLTQAMKAKEDLYFSTHQWGTKTVRSNGVTFEELFLRILKFILASALQHGCENPSLRSALWAEWILNLYRPNINALSGSIRLLVLNHLILPTRWLIRIVRSSI